MLLDEGVRRSNGSEFSRSTLGNWRRKVFRNRYSQMRRLKMDEVDRVTVEASQDLAQQIAEIEGRAVKQTAAGLAHADAYEASQILRNLSQSKKMQIDGATQLRGEAVAREQTETMTNVLKEIAGLGIAVVNQQLHGAQEARAAIDGEAEEIHSPTGFHAVPDGD